MPTLRTWLQLFRAPNLFTVPGDPLAGYLLASYGAFEPLVLLALGASLCFYAGGLLLNDLADLREDRAERPERPLPSGAASPAIVGVVMLALFLGGLLLCKNGGDWTLGVGVVLMIAVTCYNLFAKRVPVLGAMNMGLCRGLSLLLGATVVPHGRLSIPMMFHGKIDHLAAAFMLVVCYIAAVTNLARHETKSSAPLGAKWLPALVLAAGWSAFIPWERCGGVLRSLAEAGTRFNAHAGMPGWRAVLEFLAYSEFALGFAVALLGCAMLTLFVSGRIAWQLTRDPAAPVPPMIGQLIRLQLIVQAAFCVATATEINQRGSGFAVMLIFLWPISREVGRRFHGS
jgi:4-hydroxybenzoate polyprenyltransferase